MASRRLFTSGVNLPQNQRVEFREVARADSPDPIEDAAVLGPIKAKPFGWPRKAQSNVIALACISAVIYLGLGTYLLRRRQETPFAQPPSHRVWGRGNTRARLSRRRRSTPGH